MQVNMEMQLVISICPRCHEEWDMVKGNKDKCNCGISGEAIRIMMQQWVDRFLEMKTSPIKQQDEIDNLLHNKDELIEEVLNIRNRLHITVQERNDAIQSDNESKKQIQKLETRGDHATGSLMALEHYIYELRLVAEKYNCDENISQEN